MTALFTPGAYLKARRSAALLDVRDVAARLRVDPPVPELQRVEWIRLIEADVMPATFNTIAALRRIYAFDFDVLAALALIALGDTTVGQPAICRICACSELDACEGGCWWEEADLCSSCAAAGESAAA